MPGNAQISLFTSPPLNGGNGAGGITFNIRAHSSVFIDTIYLALYGTVGNSTNLQLWYNTTAINGAPNISAPAWTQIHASVPGIIGNSTTTNASGFVFTPIVIPNGLLMNAGDHFGFAAAISSGSSGNVAYSGTTTTPSQIDTFTNGFITIYTGTNVGYGGPPPSPPNHVRQFTGGVSLRPASGRDSRLAALVSPATLQLGANTVVARVQNAAADPIVLVDFGYQFQSNPPVLQPGIAMPSPLSPGQTYDHTFPTPINIPSTGNYQLKVWATNANGMGADNNTANDTLLLNLCTGLTGTYTVGGPSASFATIQDAVAALVQCGLSSPVTFQLNPGTYIGHYNIPANIPGAGAQNAISFVSLTGNAADVILQNDTAAATATNRSVFTINTASRVSFYNLSFRRTINPGAAAQGLLTYGHLQANGDVIGCAFQDVAQISSTNNIGIYYRGSNGFFSGNSFSGFYYGIFMDGPALNPFVNGNMFLSNTLTNYIYRAI